NGAGVATVGVSIAEAALLYATTGTTFQGAYGTRKLRAAYTGPALTLRRASDNTTQDIGFAGDGTLDPAAVTALAAGGATFVTKLYDQTTLGQNLLQADTAKQPQFTTASGAFYAMVGDTFARPVMRVQGGQHLALDGFKTRQTNRMAAVATFQHATWVP